jgi:formate/nitrite transporter
MLAPSEVAVVAAKVGEKKANLPWWKMLILGMFAGAFIALAGVGATFANVYVGKLAGALVFPAGLAMVVIAGSELFTGNNLMVIGLFDRRFGVCKLFKNWFFVFIGNLLGALVVAGLVAVSGVFDPIAETVMATASAKVNLGFAEAMIRGVLCNFLVCIAVWMAFAAETVGGKIAAVFLPIMLFVLCGFEHSVANMFYVPAGMFMAGLNGLVGPSIAGFLAGNLLPVALGNIIGGAIFVGGGYYLTYLKKK